MNLIQARIIQLYSPHSNKMNLIIIAITKKNFSQFYDIKQYKKHASEQFVVRKYAIGSKKIILNEK